VNFVGHIHIAELCFDDLGLDDPSPANGNTERYLFGSALPDFAAIGRFQLTGAPSDPAVTAGIDMHHATDSAFHASDWFLGHSQAVRSDLEARGVNRGAARAVGHVGVELLLDGQLLASNDELRPRAQHVLRLSDNEELQLTRLVDDSRRWEWSRHLNRISSWPLPDDYHRPQAVAERLHRILRSRKRLALAAADVTVVAETLADHQAELVAGVGDMTEHLVDELTESET